MSDYIPDWLLPEILCRLPVESLLRCRCVSKQWYSLISSPDFISLYTSPPAPPLFLLRYFSTKPKKQEKYFVYSDPSSKTENNTLVKELKFPFKTASGRPFGVVGFCNGLVFLSHDTYGYTNTFILWNPAIRKSITLSKPRFCSCPNVRYHVWLGFGFDHKTRDFKVVRMAYPLGANWDYIGPSEVEVYKLSTGLWKTVNSKGFNNKLVMNNTSVYLNGAIHRVSYSEKRGEITNSLLVFNLSAETFSEIGLPLVLTRVCSGELCVVWVMNQYGKLESWMEKFVVDPNGGIENAIGFTRNGEFLIEPYPGDLSSYDPESGEFYDLGIYGRADSFFMSKYIESLVLLDGRSGAIADPSIASESDSEEETEYTSSDSD
ncbi:hypothetical protein HAX54_000694 [Datura stramonium]|uniref:F-box domain-containing protein n=1 Tax=Datura stramonium TaxID=4076 RepID=A0ABS8T1C9_DATST|nr:hypothetical protein [Datura stramonium]